MAETLNLSRPGQANKTGEADAMFMKVFTGEVMTAYAEVNIMKDLHRMRTIDHGKSASFAVLGKATARYHVPGTAILGSNQIAANERTINIDDLLIADVAIYDLEDAKNHYDVRQEYSKQLGWALAREFDKKTMRVAVLAARGAGIIDDEPGGAVIKGGPTVATDGEVLADSMFACAQTWDEKDVLEWERSFIVRPAQYYLLAQTTKVLNRDWGGEGVYADGTVLKVSGLQIIKSNNLPNTNITTATTGEKNNYIGDFSNTVALALQKEAIGTVKLKDLTVEKSGDDFHIMYQSTMMVAKYAMGHGILRPSCAIEVSKATA
ncbi:phage capsid protein [uncultured Desulfovibrio sp.]|uniref:phage capsid protein n=1 Tax=uncultured Desulfovibrio sp. TaxID=167968 RepID=UPI002628E976|nr:phage capsid protein [uncultured Desulfovibrio sp.]